MTFDHSKRAAEWAAAIAMQYETAERMKLILQERRVDIREWTTMIVRARDALDAAAMSINSAGEWTDDHRAQWLAAYDAIRVVELTAVEESQRRAARKRGAVDGN